MGPNFSDKERYGQRLDEFSRALARLAEALAAPKNDLVRDAVIQRFEFTFELAWKTMKLWLALEGVQAATPAQILAESLRAELILDGNGWSRMQERRNQTSHTYHLETAEEVYAFVGSEGLSLFRVLEIRLRARPR